MVSVPRVNVPRIVVAAPASGHGKTTVATGLLAAFAARGLAVAGFKVGPDYIDPGYHALASGRPGRNLDPTMVGTDLIGPLFAHGAAGARLAVIEGVMGLYDGRATPAGTEGADGTGGTGIPVTGLGGGDPGSTAEVAALLSAPVLLVVDASAQGRSVAALVHGFRGYSPQIRFAGVLLNRVGSDRHEAILRAALEEVGTPVLGVLRRHDAVAAPSRHLGLVPVAERRPEALASVRALADLVAASVDLDAVLAAARSAPPLDARPWSPAVEPVDGRSVDGRPMNDRPVVAVAGGPAFSFGYAETVELLKGAGAQVSILDPVHDEKLPDGTAALVVGGGFPEVYAAELAANAPLRAQVSALAAGGAPIAAECAGLLWLCRTLDGAPMCGVLPADAAMTGRLTLGYRDAVARTGSWLGPAGTRITGHEFHRTAVTPAAGPTPAWSWAPPSGQPAESRTGKPAEGGAGVPAEGWVAGRVHASYLHLHWAARPQIARGLVAACG
ncbi:cobyrinate a,c-diamide synthase [Rugosimonospora africana]|uniref:Hydrogenobyrinate a,c-diamide synthase n=1 Tax=Rugosimonospora africana TaxID=556532 RepID=A0A8J3QQ25_9ACTN|nr:cobyrinate a,c-diamide synthase [Rugosimonospora africana]GIH14834.1 hydrogenobyrinate a,c-diamide synthase [Rugosimonospora africana]